MANEETKKCPKCKEDVAKDAKKCKHCGTDLRNWFVRHKVLTGILGFFVLVVIISAVSSDDTSTTTVGDSNTSTTATTEKATTKETAKEYVKVLSFSGNGQKKSETFKITGDRFKVAYDCKGDLCQAWASQPGSDLSYESIMNTTEAVKDETIIYENGEWYIEVNSIGNWSMTVYDYR